MKRILRAARNNIHVLFHTRHKGLETMTAQLSKSFNKLTVRKRKSIVMAGGLAIASLVLCQVAQTFYRTPPLLQLPLQLSRPIDANAIARTSVDSLIRIGRLRPINDGDSAALYIAMNSHGEFLAAKATGAPTSAMQWSIITVNDLERIELTYEFIPVAADTLVSIAPSHY